MGLAIAIDYEYEERLQYYPQLKLVAGRATKKSKTIHKKTNIIPQFELTDGSDAPTVTKDETLGGLGASLTVKNEYLVGSERQKIDEKTGKPVLDENGKPVMERTNGAQEIASDFNRILELPTNLPRAFDRVNTAVGDVGNVAANTVNGRISIGEAVDLLGNVKLGKLRDQKEAENKNNEIADSVNNLLGGNAENARETLKNEVDSTTATLGGSNTNADGTKRETYVYDSVDPKNETMQTPDGQTINKNDASAITETNSKDIGFDMRNPELQNGVEVQKITTHEASHRAGYGEGASALLGNVAADVWAEQNKANNRATNTATDPVVTQANFLTNPANAPTLQAGNDKVENIKEGQPMSLEGAFRMSWQADYGKSPEESGKDLVDKVKASPTYQVTSKVGYVLAMELTPFGDISRIGLGVDPYTGEKLTMMQRGLEAAECLVFLGPGKMINIASDILKIQKMSTKTVNLIDTTVKTVGTIKDVNQGLIKEFKK